MTSIILRTLKWVATVLLVCGLSFSCQPVNTIPEPVVTGEVEVSDFSATRGDMHIGGKAYMPKGLNVKKPALICCHGLFGSYKDMEAYAHAAAKIGIASFCFDFCGGSADGSLSDGDALDNTILTQIEDLAAVYDAVSGRNDIDRSQIIVIGASQGGLVSALFAVQNPSKVKALGLLFPAFNLPDIVRTATEVLFENTDNLPEYVGIPSLGITFGRKYILYAYDLYPLDMIGAYEGPVFILHGDKDLLVPLEYSEKAVKKYKDANLVVLKGQDHMFKAGGPDKAIELLENWYRQNLDAILSAPKKV